jgi:hypothetical protein
MWPKKDMEITWKIMDNPNGKGKTLMTDGGKKWGTHDLVTKKKYTDYEGHVEFVMMGARGAELLEYNVRFGDPETEVLLPSLKTDLADIIRACLNGCLGEVRPGEKRSRRHARWFTPSSPGCVGC